MVLDIWEGMFDNNWMALAINSMQWTPLCGFTQC